jgi:5-carboxymethyl-2-hydroxymuconic-semialdehyde dehydrogenase
VIPEAIGHFIGGRTARSSYGKTFGVPDPATGKEYTQVEVGVEADVNRAVREAQAALTERTWSGLPPGARAALLDRIAAGIGIRAGQIAGFETLGAGLPTTQARQQAAQAASCFRRAAEAITAPPADRPAELAKLGSTLRRPEGVAGVITSWRSPFLALARAVAPALAAGCTVVLQVDVWAPLSAALLPEIVTEAGLPAGVLNIVHGTGNWRGEGATARTTARDALVAHQNVPLIWFTGDAAAGERAAREAAARRKRLFADLPGNAPCVILEDADLDRAVSGALFGAFALNGGRRTASSRVLVARPVYNAVLARLVEEADRLRVGAPGDPQTEIGPLVHAEHYDRVTSAMRRAIRDGVRPAAGGRHADGLAEGNYLAPTVLADVTPDMAIFGEVISAPVLCVTPFDTDGEAVTLAAALAGAPAAYLWTAERHRANRLALAIGTPVTWVNAHNPGDLRTSDDATATRDAVDFYTRPTVIYTAQDAAPAPRLGGR